MALRILMYKYLFLIILFSSAVSAENSADIFNLEMSQKNCTDATPDFSSKSSSYTNGDQVYAELSTALNCSMKAANPRLYIGQRSLTIAIDQVSPSGAVAACKCRSEIDFRFTIPGFKKTKFESIFFTIDGAVQSEAKIINESKQKELPAVTR